jgi:uncharacterized protein
MIYLLDVNALVALGFTRHQFHNRMTSWLQAQQFPPLATCSITELGFVRILAQAPAYGYSVTQGRTLLLRLKRTDFPRFTFLDDTHDIAHLPPWVKTAKQTTDGHLVNLATGNGALLATFDNRIPGAYLIPDN